MACQTVLLQRFVAQTREVPKTPLSAVGGWLRRTSTTRLDKTMSILFLDQQPLSTEPQLPLLARLEVRANLGSLKLEACGTEGQPLSAVSQEHRGISTNAEGAPMQHTTASSSTDRDCLGLSDISEQGVSTPAADAAGSASGDTAPAEPNHARLQQLLCVHGVRLTLLPQPDPNSPSVDFEGNQPTSCCGSV